MIREQGRKLVKFVDKNGLRIKPGNLCYEYWSRENKELTGIDPNRREMDAFEKTPLDWRTMKAWRRSCAVVGGNLLHKRVLRTR
jgi:hypothetical protein